eukprot:g39977.t1
MASCYVRTPMLSGLVMVIVLLQTIYNAMENGTPCVIVEGSGRVADVLANAADLPVAQITISFIQKQLRVFFAETYTKFSEQEIISWTKK